MSADAGNVSDLGEFGLIERIRERLPAPPDGEIWSGDDAAVLAGLAGRPLITIDTLAEGRDFDWQWFSPADVGWKALAVNVSDIAAMGGRPRYAVASMTVERTTALGTVDDLVDGLVAAAAEWRVNLVGGDINEGDDLSVSIALLGESGDAVVTRAGARPGDVIGVTGELGGAAGGLLALREGKETTPAAETLATRQRRPRARVAEGAALASAGATAMIDVSDGFLADLAHILDASRTGCDVDPSAIPIDPALREVDLGRDPLELALTGGEDFELIFTIPPDRWNEAERTVGDVGGRIARVGEVISSGRTVGDRRLEEWTNKGWDHLRDQ